MTNWIRSWSPKVEFAVVLFIAFSWPLLGSAMHLLRQQQVALFTSYRLLWTAMLEVASLTLIISILHLRSTDFSTFGLNPSWRLTVKGLLLFLVAVLANRLTIVSIVFIYPPAGAQLIGMNLGHPNVIASIALSLVNPVFEEVLVVGYVITSLERLSTTSLALLTSVTLRASYHLYQGLAGAAGVAVLGLLFGYVLIKKGQLWPLIVAHGITNLLSLLAMSSP